MQHAGVRDFDSQKSHIHWVYCAYLLLNTLNCPEKGGISERQKWLNDCWKSEKARDLFQMTTQFWATRDFTANSIRINAPFTDIISDLIRKHD
jgi:hypothetical protein